MMSEERLQEIKDSIDFQREILIANNMKTLCVDEEQELYDEVVRLKKQKDDVVEYIKNLEGDYDLELANCVKYEILRMLGEVDVED